MVKNSPIIFAIYFVCLWFFFPLENFSLIWRLHHCQWRAANFDLCSALMANEQWGFFSMPHLLWHGTSVYNDHLRGPVTLTLIAERLAVELSLPVFTTLIGLSRLGFEHPIYCLRGECSTLLFINNLPLRKDRSLNNRNPLLMSLQLVRWKYGNLWSYKNLRTVCPYNLAADL